MISMTNIIVIIYKYALFETYYDQIKETIIINLLSINLDNDNTICRKYH